MLVASIVSGLTDAVTSAIGDHGLYAVFALMLVDAIFPAASEVVMLYAGALAAGAFAGQDVVLFGTTIDEGWTAYVAVALAGTIGYTIGAIIGWAIGVYGGRPYLERHGRWLHLDEEKLDRAERWFARWRTGLPRTAHARDPVVRLHSRRRDGGAVRPLPLLASRARRSGASDLRASALRSARVGRTSRTHSGTSTTSSRPSSSRRPRGSAGASCGTVDAAWPRIRRGPDEPGCNGLEAKLARVTQQIPLIDVKAQYAPLIPELEERFRAVLDSGRFIFGPEVEAFEREAAAYLGVPHAIGVANGTDALVIVLDAMEIGPGDEVICPAFTFYATAESIARRGATPVFADVDPVTLNLDPVDVAAKITDRTRAIMPVHLFGRPGALVSSLRSDCRSSRTPRRRSRRGYRPDGICSTFQLLPDEEPSRSVTAGSWPAWTTRSPRVSACSASTARATRRPSSSSGRTRGSTPCRLAMLRVFCHGSPAGTRLGGRRRQRYAELGGFVDTPWDDAGHVYHLYVVRPSLRAEIAEASPRRGSPALRIT